MQLTVETIQNVAIVKVLAEQLDASNADEFKREIAPVLAAQSQDGARSRPGPVRGQQRLRRHPVVPEGAARRPAAT